MGLAGAQAVLDNARKKAAPQNPPNANAIVAARLREARRMRGWTQDEAAERLEPYLGKRWSRASFSASERYAYRQDRSRTFDAIEIDAFARVFGLPHAWFFGYLATDLDPDPGAVARRLQHARAALQELGAFVEEHA